MDRGRRFIGGQRLRPAPLGARDLRRQQQQEGFIKSSGKQRGLLPRLSQQAPGLTQDEKARCCRVVLRWLRAK
jgi:hypothetical protein